MARVMVDVLPEELSYRITVESLLAVEVFCNATGPVARLRSFCCGCLIVRLEEDLPLICEGCGFTQPCSDQAVFFYHSLPEFADLLENWLFTQLCHSTDPLTAQLYAPQLADRVLLARDSILWSALSAEGEDDEQQRRAKVEEACRRKASSLSTALL